MAIKTHNKFSSQDKIQGDKFQQIGDANKIILGMPNTHANTVFVLIVAPLVVGILILAVEYFGLIPISSLIRASQDVDYSTELQSDTPRNSFLTCTRTTRLDNSAAYDRALSLVGQRIGENDRWCDKHCEDQETENRIRFNYFSASLSNCIKIIEEDIVGQSEGYFTFFSDDIKNDYFPVKVDSGYAHADDILTALLITHEMTHVQQYIDIRNNNLDILSCREKEVEAFVSQLKFFTLLNSE